MLLPNVGFKYETESERNIYSMALEWRQVLFGLTPQMLRFWSLWQYAQLYMIYLTSKPTGALHCTRRLDTTVSAQAQPIGTRPG